MLLLLLCVPVFSLYFFIIYKKNLSYTGLLQFVMFVLSSSHFELILVFFFVWFSSYFDFQLNFFYFRFYSLFLSLSLSLSLTLSIYFYLFFSILSHLYVNFHVIIISIHCLCITRNAKLVEETEKKTIENLSKSPCTRFLNKRRWWWCRWGGWTTS